MSYSSMSVIKFVCGMLLVSHWVRCCCSGVATRLADAVAQTPRF